MFRRKLIALNHHQPDNFNEEGVYVYPCQKFKHSMCISNIFSFETESPDPDSPRKNEKAKKFWSFVKSLKNDAFGINTLRENRILKTDTLDKANICKRQFQSAFTRESDDEIPSKGTSHFTPMGEITVDPNGVLKLLNNLKIHKASGPDGLSARVLKECSSEIAPILTLMGEYLTTGLFVSRVNLNNIDLVNCVKTILFNKT